MSGFGGGADAPVDLPKSPLIATSGHSTVIPAAWILRSMVVSLLVEGEAERTDDVTVLALENHGRPEDALRAE